MKKISVPSRTVFLLLPALVLGCHSPIFPMGHQAQATQRSGKNLMGINLNFGATDDYSQDRVFADAMKSARMWYAGSNLNSPQPVALDSNFWPTADACLCVMAGLDRNEGTYHCQFTGQATVGPASYGLAGTCSPAVYDGSTNTSTFTVEITQSGGTFSLAFSNTKRLPTDSAATGITNLQIMRPMTEGSTQSYPFVTPPASRSDPTYVTQFTDQIKALVSKFHLIRFMDFFRTNGNQLVSDSQRPVLTDASYSSAYRALPDLNNDGYTQPSGGSWEAAVDLCNQTGCDLWLNIPLHANDDYVIQAATLIKTRLNTSLNVYVEYSNEVWNTGGGFTQGNENHILAQNEEAAGVLPSLKSSAGDTNDWMWAWRRVGRRIVQISDLFRAVWGDAAMPSPTNTSPRIRPVLMAQQGYEAGPEDNALMYLDRNCKTTSNDGSAYYPHPLNYYLYGCGGSGYYNPSNDPGLNLESLWNSETMSPANWYPVCEIETVLARSYGLKRICYEGGPSLDKGSNNDPIRAVAWGDPRMQQNLVNHVDQAWNATDSDLFVFYASAGDYQWGFTQNLFDLATPKLQAINTLNSQARESPNLGQVPPFTVNGANDDAYLVWNGGYGYLSGTAMDEGSGDSLMYAFRTVNPGTYTLVLNADAGTDSYEVLCDGVQVAVFAANAAAFSQPISLPGLNPGVHVITIRTDTLTPSVNAVLLVRSLTFTGP